MARKGARQLFASLVLLLALVFLGTSPAVAVPTLLFDNTGAAGGSVLYPGLGVPLIGTGIGFDHLNAIDVPMNTGTFDCVDCLLTFATGLNTSEGPPSWTWDGGGTFTLTGAVPAAGVAAGVLLTGTWFTPVGAIGGEETIVISGRGEDTKNPVLAAFFGLSPTGWRFSNTEITATPTFFTPPFTGGFTASVDEADARDSQTVSVPAPAALLLLGAGLLGLAAVGRRSKA